MSHDKIRAAARKRMAETGEPYAAARRAVIGEHQAAGGQIPPPGAGYTLRMSGEIHDWLAGLRSSDSPAAARVRTAVATLMKEGAGLGDPLVTSTAESWPWTLAEALDRSYQQHLDRLQVLRRGEADATTLSRDIQDQIVELESARAKLDNGYRRALDAGKPQEAAQAMTELAAIQQQAAEARRLLPGVIEARRRLAAQNQRLQARAEALRVRKEVLKASFTRRNPASGSTRPSPPPACAVMTATGGRTTVTRRSARRKPGSPISPPRWSANWARKPGQKA